MFNLTTVKMTVVISHNMLRDLKCRKLKWVAGSMGRNASKGKALGKKHSRKSGFQMPRRPLMMPK